MSETPPAHRSAPPVAVQGAVRAATIFLAVVAAGALVRVFRPIVSPLVVATFLLLLIDGLSRDLDARFPRVPRLARGAFAAVLIVAGFAAVVLLMVLQGPPFALELAGIEPHVNALLADTMALIGQPPITLHDIFRGADPTKTLGKVLGAARSGVTYAVLVMIYLGFLLASRGAFSFKLGRLYRTEQR
ncbi:MAG: hypothetical protein ACREEQ_02895, partial [Caulobacteraceae bacterium]